VSRRHSLALDGADVAEEFSASKYGGTADVVIAMSKELARLRAANAALTEALKEVERIDTYRTIREGVSVPKLGMCGQVARAALASVEPT
jgi:hypothetical protein